MHTQRAGSIQPVLFLKTSTRIRGLLYIFVLCGCRVQYSAQLGARRGACASRLARRNRGRSLTKTRCCERTSNILGRSDWVSPTTSQCGRWSRRPARRRSLVTDLYRLGALGWTIQSPINHPCSFSVLCCSSIYHALSWSCHLSTNIGIHLCIPLLLVVLHGFLLSSHTFSLLFVLPKLPVT